MKVWLVLFLSFFFSSKAFDSTPDGVPSRFDYKASFKTPYFIEGLGIPHFSNFGSVILSDDYIRLTPSVRSMQGSIWLSSPIQYENWEVVIRMMISGRGKLGGDGVAFWYTSNILRLGPALGSEQVFDGLMIGFDTYDNDSKRNNPYIFGVLNDGTVTFDPDKDGDEQSFAGCLENIRNTPVPTYVRIRYLGDVLKVEVDTSAKGKKFKTCFESQNIQLPKGYHFGLSAATGALADDHDILSFEVYELNPPPKTGPTQKLENLSEDELKRFEKVQDQVQQQKAKDALPFEMDENYKVFFGEALGKDEILSQLSRITSEQEKILATLAKIESKPAVVQSNNGPVNSDQATRTSINEISNKLIEIQNEMRSRLTNIEKQPSGNQGSISEMKVLLEQTLMRMNRPEPQNIGSIVQQLKDDIRRVQETVEESGSTDTTTIIVAVIALLSVVALIAMSLKKSSDMKKFV